MLSLFPRKFELAGARPRAHSGWPAIAFANWIMRLMALIYCVAGVLLGFRSKDAGIAALFAILAFAVLAFAEVQAWKLRRRKRELADAVQTYEAALLRAFD